MWINKNYRKTSLSYKIYLEKHKQVKTNKIMSWPFRNLSTPLSRYRNKCKFKRSLSTLKIFIIENTARLSMFKGSLNCLMYSISLTR